jgi:hypothetical protein
MKETILGLSTIAVGGVLAVLFNSLVVGIGFIAVVAGLTAFVGAVTSHG